MKILIVPLVITIAVICFVWLIYPAYSNGKDGVMENYAKLKEDQKKLNDLRSENSNIASLSNQISALTQKDALYSFIPESAKEEEIINSLGQLASESGLLLFDATVNQPAKATASVASLNLDDSNASEEDNKPQIKKLSAEMKLAGNYDSIRSFLGKLGGFSRSNDVSDLEIMKNDSKGGAVSGSGTLIVDVSADFNFLAKEKLSEDSVLNSVFSSPKLNSKIIEDIQAQKSVNGYQLSVGQKGRPNLFQ